MARVPAAAARERPLLAPGLFDGFHETGMIPVSMIRWEMTGLDDEVRRLGITP